jgi:hypothetical protein
MSNPTRRLETGLLFPTVAFVASLIVMTSLCTWGWEIFVKDHIYNCTDDIPLDYLQPGHWVHSPVAVKQVVKGRPMSEADTIKESWSLFGLWLLWMLFAGGSVVSSGLVAVGVSHKTGKSGSA